MAIPNKATGGCNNSTAQNVFRVLFTQPLAAAPKLEVWDTSALTTYAKQAVVGTSGNSGIPLIYAIETTDQIPASNWKPAAMTSGSAYTNRLRGNIAWVTLCTGAVGANEAVRFNIGLEVPYDATVPSTNTLDPVIAIRYTYASGAPSVTFSFNEGTEGTPTWTTITSGAAGHKVRFGDAGSAAGTVSMARPGAGVSDSGEVWVTT